MIHRLKKNADIIFIVLVGAILRIGISVTHSYSNDELSAINRLEFTNYSDLIEIGVKTGDMHPAGVQIFMKVWSSIGGVSEGWMRFPFVLCGILSIVAIFFVGKKWFNRRAGVIAAILLSTLYFPVLNSEFARPYSPGLLICLLIAWWMHKVLICEVKQWKHAIILGFLFAAAMYTHYFAFLTAGFMGMTGLILLNKGNLKYYLVAAILGVVLFLPHLGITAYHLSVGGLGWLAPPDLLWLKGFLFHAFNESNMLLVILTLLLVASIFYRRNVESYKKVYILLFVCWFFGTYLLGHFLSIIGTPVLKYPVMLFALPFLFLGIGFCLSRFRVYYLAFSILGAACINSTLFEKNLFGNNHFGLFEESAQKITEWEKTVGEDNTVIVYNLSNPNYMNYYANQWDKEIDFDLDVIEYGDSKKIRDLLVNRNEEYCIIGYSARLTLVDIFETAKAEYPFIVDYQAGNNWAVFFLQRRRLAEKTVEQESELISAFTKRRGDKRWKVDEKSITADSFTLNSVDEVGPTFIIRKGELKLNGKYMRLRYSGMTELGSELTLTVSVFRNGEPVLQANGENFWYGKDIVPTTYLKADEPGTGVFNGQYSLDVFDDLRDDDEIRINFWNRNNSQVYIRELSIELLENIWN